MKLGEIYARTGPKVSIEFFPPRTPEARAAFEANLPAFKALQPAFCSLTMGAAGSGAADLTVSLVTRLKQEEGIEMMCHFTCIGKSRDEVRLLLGQLKSGGVENIIALRGDPPKGQAEWTPHPDGFKYAIELVREAKRLGGFGIAVAGFPETHPEAASPESDVAYLKAKVDAGADAVITQLFFDNAVYLDYVERVRRAGVRVPVVAGILPIRTAAWVRKFVPLCGATIPPELELRLQRYEQDDEGCRKMGIEWAARQIRGLLEAGVTAFHLYSLNDPGPVTAILEDTGLSRLTSTG